MANRGRKSMLDVQLKKLDDDNGVRLRPYSMVKSVLQKREHSESMFRQLSERHRSVRSDITQMKMVRDDRTARPKKKQVDLLNKRIAKQEKVQERIRPQLEHHRSVLEKTDTLRQEHIPAVQQDERWVTDQGIQSVNMRILGNWHRDGSQWVQRNQGRNIQEGEYLNATDQGWTDYINQGWMQGGFDRGAGFRLVTKVPQQVRKMHNKASEVASRPEGKKPGSPGNWAEYGRNLSQMATTRTMSKFKHSSEDRMTYFGQELVDAARNGYRIHTDATGKQSLMPHQKSLMLSELRTKVKKVK